MILDKCVYRCVHPAHTHICRYFEKHSIQWKEKTKNETMCVKSLTTESDEVERGVDRAGEDKGMELHRRRQNRRGRRRRNRSDGEMRTRLDW